MAYEKTKELRDHMWKKHEEEVKKHPEIPNEHAGRLRHAANYLEDRAARGYGHGHHMEHHGEGKPHGHKE